jgi:hypothetical protein
LDAELAVGELETHMEEELQKGAIEARAKAEAALKTRQTQERAAMLGFLMESNEGSGGGSQTIGNYLNREKRQAQKELEAFKRDKEREKNERIQALVEIKAKREQEMREKEEKMINWEYRV